MIKKILALILMFTLLIPFAVACNSESTESESTAKPTETSGKKTTATKNTQSTNKNNNSGNKLPEADEIVEEDPFKDGKLSIDGVDISKYVIVVAEDAKSRHETLAKDLAAWIKEITGNELAIVNDTAAPVANEIIVGSTNRPETTALGSSFDGQKSYKVSVGNGKLAVNFSATSIAGTSALNAIKRAFANNGCNITNSFTNQTLTPEQIQPLVLGAMRTELKNGGLYVHKSTQAQVDAWHALTVNYDDYTKENVRAATGIRIEFETDSSYVGIKLSKTLDRTMVLLVNNKVLTSSWTGSPWEIPAIYQGKTNKITILMSNLRHTDDWCIQSLEIDGECKAGPHKTDINMLFIGDSITEGHDSGLKPASTYTFYTSTYFNANAVVQGYGCGQCWTEMIDPTMAQYYQPDVIIVAMGTNDYGSNRNQTSEWFKNRMDAFLDKIESVYPGVPIIGVTPIRRLLDMSSKNPESNYDTVCVAMANAGYAQAYREHGAVLVEGDRLIKKAEHYADVLHPNAEGFIVYGESLCIVIEDYINAIINSKKNK